MPQFCDVALPVPLEAKFTYRIQGIVPVVGGRVLVPFRTGRLAGVVTALHDTLPDLKTKEVLQVLDSSPVLDEALLKLGEWIATYYLAPIGEVFRAMLPLSAEVKRQWAYRMADGGEKALYASSLEGSSLRSKRSTEEQMLEYEVLNYLSRVDSAREGTLRSATGAARELLRGMQRKKWILREDISAVRDARRTIKVALLTDAALMPAKLNANQQLIIDTLKQDVLKREARKQELPTQEAVNQKSLEQKSLKQDSLKQDSPKQEPLGSKSGTQGSLRQEEPPAEAPRGSRAGVEVSLLNELDVPRTTLRTLVQRGLVSIHEEPAGFSISSMQQRARMRSKFELNPDQQHALSQINQTVAEQRFSVSVLHGVTGSGKTAVYLAAMQGVLDQGRSAILLVPEIGLTPAAAAHLHHIFGEQVAILHSALSGDERAEQWHRIQYGQARMVVGTRSAIFAPVKNLALIVVDEEHDSSYKQEEMPRYHGRDVAVMRGKLDHAAVVLGSATPSLESYYNAATGKYKLIELRERVEQRPLPDVEVVDMRGEFQQTGEEQLFSRKLLEEIGERLSKEEQVIVLLNRRGYSAVVLCRSCGETIQCKNCAIAMTHHKAGPYTFGRAVPGQRLECHYCGYQLAAPKVCPKCQSEHIYFLGTGSEKVEEKLHGLFPAARIGRLDRDTVRGRDDFERVLNQLHAGELDILVGTQMIAKGHDIHGVTLVGVVGADAALGFPDFRAAERTFQLLTQVAGRAGRGTTPGKVILQTYFSDHYAIQFSAAHDFRGFYDKELRYRRWMHYPPFSSIANVLLRSDKLDEAIRFSGIVAQWFENTRLEDIRVLGPAVAPISRLKRDYRYHFILKSASREKLNGALRRMLHDALNHKIPRTNIVIDVDALSLL